MKTYQTPKQLTIYPGAVLWIVRDSETGENIGPTPFETSIPAAEVLGTLRRLNPGSTVTADAPGAELDSIDPAPVAVPAPTSTEPGARVLITGNTYPVKEALRALGGRWNPTARGWMVEAHLAAEAHAIVASAGPQGRRPSRYGARRPRTTSTYTRFSSGAEMYTNRAGRCEDAPCCGCCS